MQSPLAPATPCFPVNNVSTVFTPNLRQDWRFATNRNANPNDACTVNTLSTNLAQSSYTVASMMADYTQADSFSLRTVGN